MKSPTRSGFTVTELIVVLTVIALLLAITIPAVQQARESARRAQCRANLSNLGKAIHGYEATRQQYPSAEEASPTDPTQQSNRDFAPHVYLLPWLDQRPLWETVNGIEVPPGVLLGPRSLGDPKIAEIAHIPVQVFLCPSDGGSFGTNYRICMGPEPYYLKSRLSPTGGTGAFTALKDYRAQDFKDGLSNTVAMSEKIMSDLDLRSYSRAEDFWYTGLTNLGGPPPTVEQMIRLCDSLQGNPAFWRADTGHTWMFASYAYTWYNHTVPPNSTVPDCSRHPGAPFKPYVRAGAGVYKASSYHSRGVNGLMMDGSVRFFSDSIDLGVWRALSTRAGGEAIETTGL